MYNINFIGTARRSYSSCGRSSNLPMGLSKVTYIPSTMKIATLIIDTKNLVTAGKNGDGSLECSFACNKEKAIDQRGHHFSLYLFLFQVST